MFSLVKREMEMIVSNNYQEKMNELLRRLNMLECEEDEKFVTDRYYELLNNFQRIPNFSDIMEYLEEYNENIFWKVAQIQFCNEFDIMQYEEIESMDEKIDDLAWGWIECCGYYYSNMIFKLEAVLRKYRLCTVCCVDDEIIDIYNPGEYARAEFVIASCQNTLMDKIIDDNCAGFDDYLIYYNPDFKDSG